MATKHRFKDKPLCIIEINENIRRVFNDEELTRPLKELNRYCKFRKRYNIAWDLRNEEKLKEENRIKSKKYYWKDIEKSRKYHREWNAKNKLKGGNKQDE